MHMNLHLEEVSLASSPWINRQHPWWVQWTTVWVSVRPSHVCWIWPRSCSGRSASVVNRFSFIHRAFHKSHLLDSLPFLILWIHVLDGNLWGVVHVSVSWTNWFGSQSGKDPTNPKNRESIGTLTDVCAITYGETEIFFHMGRPNLPWIRRRAVESTPICSTHDALSLQGQRSTCNGCLGNLVWLSSGTLLPQLLTVCPVWKCCYWTIRRQQPSV